MSVIQVSITAIPGESTRTSYVGQIECIAMRHAIDLPVIARGNQRTYGSSQHGAIEMTHRIDKASPLLRHAVSAGTNLGTVVVTKLEMISGALKPSEVITLNNVYITQVAVLTQIDPANIGAGSTDPLEMFEMDYSRVEWVGKRYDNGVETGSVTGLWNIETQQIA